MVQKLQRFCSESFDTMHFNSLVFLHAERECRAEIDIALKKFFAGDLPSEAQNTASSSSGESAIAKSHGVEFSGASESGDHHPKRRVPVAPSATVVPPATATINQMNSYAPPDTAEINTMMIINVTPPATEEINKMMSPKRLCPAGDAPSEVRAKAKPKAMPEQVVRDRAMRETMRSGASAIAESHGVIRIAAQPASATWQPRSFSLPSLLQNLPRAEQRSAAELVRTMADQKAHFSRLCFEGTRVVLQTKRLVVQEQAFFLEVVADAPVEPQLPVQQKDVVAVKAKDIVRRIEVFDGRGRKNHGCWEVRWDDFEPKDHPRSKRWRLPGWWGQRTSMNTNGLHHGSHGHLSRRREMASQEMSASVGALPWSWSLVTGLWSLVLSHLSMVRWYHGTMGPWYHGSMVPWLHDTMALLRGHGTTVPWFHGPMSNQF